MSVLYLFLFENGGSFLKITIFSKVLSDPFLKLYEVLFHYLMNRFLWKFGQWTSELCPFHISNIIFWYKYTLTNAVHITMSKTLKAWNRMMSGIGGS